MKFESKTNIEKYIGRIDKKYYWVVSGLFTTFLVLILLSITQMAFGGKYIFMRGDLFDTHVPYIIMFCRNILNRESIFYSYNNSMGINTSLILAYYTLSPFNILYLIFFKANPDNVTIIVIILKLFFASCFFQLFSQKVLKNDGFSSILFSVMYSLCGFVSVYGMYHIMWLDAFLALPLLCIILHWSLINKKYWPLVLIYTYLFISQFYMAYMVGFFSLICVLGYLLFIEKSETQKRIKSFLGWLIAVLISAMLSSWILLPAFLFLKNNNPPDASVFLDNEYTITELVNSLFWGEYFDLIGKRSVSYCGLPCLLLIPSFFRNDLIRKDTKKFFGLLLAAVAICYTLPFMYKFMHAFDAPDYFWFRFSFLLSFLLCGMGCYYVRFYVKTNIKELIIYTIILIILYSLEQRLQAVDTLKYSANSGFRLFINCIFITLWIVISYLLVNRKLKKSSLYAISSVLLIIELLSNTYLCMDYKVERDQYLNWYNNTKNGVTEAKEISDPYHRLIVSHDLSHNSDSLFDYMGIGDFGSAENYKLRIFLSNIGFSTTPRVTAASGFTPVSEMLLGVEYVIVNPDKGYFLDGGDKDEYYLVKNDYCLNLGYMVNEQLEDFSFLILLASSLFFSS